MIWIFVLACTTGAGLFCACLGFRWLAEEWSRPGPLPAGGDESGRPGPLHAATPDLPDFPACDKWTLIALGARARFK